MYEHGRKKQTEMIIEECAELIHAIQKYKRNQSGENLAQVCEELADVRIMVEQALHIFKCTYDVDQYVDQKIERLRERLDRGTY